MRHAASGDADQPPGADFALRHGLLLIFGATIFALEPPHLFDRSETERELIRTDNTPTPEGLESLPRSYGDLPRPIELGSPLPGDLGGAVLDTERELGIEPAPSLPFRPNPEDDAARAERIRQARLTQQGRESGVFFQLSTRTTGGGHAPATIGAATATPSPTEHNPFYGLRTAESDQGLGLNLQNDQNLQGRKLDFLRQGVEANIYNPHALQDPASPYQVIAGTIIPASLVTGINSDLPDRLIAQVTENVYDTVSGRYLLIPQCARVIGTYDSVVAFGQSRALVVWRRIIMPDGSSVVIENLPATDTAGYAGLEIDNNAGAIVNYGERYRNGEPISSSFAESAINQVVAKRFVKKQ